MFNSFNFINKTQMKFFKEYGYLVIQNQLTYKIKHELKKHIQDIERDSLKRIPNYIHKFEYDKNMQKQLCRTEDIIKHKEMKNFLTEGLLPETISQLFENEAILYKEKINYKYPNTGLYRSHQDITAYPNSKNHITALINLGQTNSENGSIEFSPLIMNNLDKNTIIKHKNGVICEPEKLKWTNPLETNYGDIILFNSYIPHRSSINISNLPRKALYITYNDISEGDLRKEYYEMKKEKLDSNKISLIDHYEGNIIEKNEKHKEYITNYIINLYKKKGNTMYDTHISQKEHSFQTMEMAIKKGFDEKFQLCCFLHDIGHLLLDENNNNEDFLKKDLKHELIGYNFLKEFLDDEITKPILLHVQAKRFLCSINNEYYNTLSNSSKESFKIQGGKMTEEQCNTFRNNSYVNLALTLREFEDISKKKENEICTDYDYIEKLLNKFIKI
tara:strand:+ start:107 stop:1441 length:1335 start_codon:yes stop_codon:yes gene_type:complete